ncbi:trna pseudouridine(38-40) synthase [Plasmopara halstedii]|uniref:Trna pseudouridine(38-40) synthase n=1 Tax=Plasmopara halstedii TaxID=4781 RepID=A0A0P1ANZ7_PLAHL|nr:trna pseudouridine(38-40) synthase [Plasmopara halstedii]CEG43178.1 trna pseudouridine(38-40) synthase [Plasmopara halstedii]|eukprot:XP_024579547.1 trna pseudouridine(38-40) synthase [Plasmopara halstedii]
MVVISPADGLPTDLRSLNTRNATPEQLLAILYELRNTVGPKVVNNAIVKVMVTNDYVVQSNECENQKLMKDKKEKHQDTSRKKKIKCKREFNLTNYSMRTVAIKFLYLGENYAGFARQDHMPETVERYLIEALKRSKLIDKIEDAEYSRCGRTDRGVSAFGQVVALRVRSNLPASAQLLTGSSIDDVKPGEKFKVRLATGEEKMVTEIDYASHLNRALPTAIRVYSVASCRSDFSARFDCKARMYRYFFLRRNLDIEKMQVAANELVGKHDFRNFCRIDTNCQVFERKIQSFQIVKCSSHTAEDPRQQMYRCEVFGRAFLWHQVRCMVEVLFLVGSGREEPSIVLQLLDIAHTPRKPQYDMAADLPLVLHDCYFASPDEKESPGPDFWYTPLALLQVHAELTAIWEQRSVQAAMLRSHLDALEEFQVDPQKVVQDLDHYAPKLEQLMQERNLLTTKGTLVRWKEVSPLLSLAKKRKTLPLAKRDTGHSVDECKRKAQERKRRRELEEQIVIEKRELAFNVSS